MAVAKKAKCRDKNQFNIILSIVRLLLSTRGFYIERTIRYEHRTEVSILKSEKKVFSEIYFHSRLSHSKMVYPSFQNLTGIQLLARPG